MKGYIKFSVIIPSYNYAAYLPDAINSVIDQNYPGTEILVIDDASTDNTQDVVKKFTGKVIYHRLDNNTGASGAWSYGLQRARGEYLCKLDADDQQIPGFLEAVDEAFALDDSIGLVATSVMMIRHDNKLPVTKSITDQDVTLSADTFRERFLHEFFFHMPGITIRRTITTSHNFPEHDLYQLHDWEYFLRVTRGYKARLIAKPLAIYRLHPNSITSTAQKEGVLEKDCNKWLELAVKKGDSYMDGAERDMIAGSLAIHMMRSIKLPGVKKILIRYPSARKLAVAGGNHAVDRLNGYILKKGIQIFIRKLCKYANLPIRIAKWLTRKIRRCSELFQKGGIASGFRYINEELKNTWTLLTRDIVVDESKVRVACNICDWKGKRFNTHCGAGYIVYDCICPLCGSFPRHRGFAYVIDNYLKADLRKTCMVPGARLLFSPEYAIYHYLQQFINDLTGVDYSTINILVNVRANISRTPFKDNSVGFISCFHVIEHVPDDRTALAELNRILNPLGKAVICVPIKFSSMKTTEFYKPNPLLEDHYYEYGLDFGYRLTEAKFKGVAFRLSKIMSDEIFKKMSLQEELIFILQKTRSEERRVGKECRL